MRTTSKRSIINWLDAAFADAKGDCMETRLRVDEVLAVLTLIRDCGITTVSIARLAGNREGGPCAGTLAVSGSDDNFRVSAILATCGGAQSPPCATQTYADDAFTQRPQCGG